MILFQKPRLLALTVLVSTKLRSGHAQEPPYDFPDESLVEVASACDLYEDTQAIGLCKTYCDKKDCDEYNPQSSHVCGIIRSNFYSITGETMPCDRPCPCWKKELLDFKIGSGPKCQLWTNKPGIKPGQKTVVASYSPHGKNDSYEAWEQYVGYGKDPTYWCSLGGKSKRLKPTLFDSCLIPIANKCLELGEALVGDTSIATTCPCWGNPSPAIGSTDVYNHFHDCRFEETTSYHEVGYTTCTDTASEETCQCTESAFIGTSKSCSGRSGVMKLKDPAEATACQDDVLDHCTNIIESWVW